MKKFLAGGYFRSILWKWSFFSIPSLWTSPCSLSFNTLHRFAIWDCLYKQPTAEAMEATAAPAIFDTAVSAAITAGFSFTNYYQVS